MFNEINETGETITEHEFTYCLAYSDGSLREYSVMYNVCIEVDMRYNEDDEGNYRKAVWACVNEVTSIHYCGLEIPIPNIVYLELLEELEAEIDLHRHMI